ncbi:MAG: hypothetical protein QY323_03170 [Patescibacteria group bacterium]|nr:MAG: hypothetical protein QY323_03170 [Patescibacteria group bacterium]
MGTSNVLAPGSGSLLYNMAIHAFMHPRKDPCDSLLESMERGRDATPEVIEKLRGELRPLREIGKEMRRLVKRARRKDPWPDRSQGSARRVALLVERLPDCFDREGNVRRSLKRATGTAAFMLKWYLSLATLGERRDMSRRAPRR